MTETTTKRPPIVLATKPALNQWRRLQERGVAPAGCLENRAAELIPPPGTTPTERRVVANGTGGKILGDTWVATFAKGRRPSGRSTWTVVAVEERRR